MSNRKQRRRKKAVEKRGDLPANSNQMSGFNAPPVGQQDKLFLNEMLKAAVVEYVDGDRDKSAGMFRHILKIEPHQAECLFRLGVIRGRKKDFLESMLLLKRAYEIAPDQYKLLRNYAIALQKMDRLQEALDIQRQAVLHEKMDRKVLVLDIANSHATLHQFFDAMEFYDEAVKLNPDNALAHYNRALNLQNLGSNQKARLAYERALEIDPDRVEVLINLSSLYRNMNELEPAEELLVHATKVSTDTDHGAFFALMGLYVRLQKIDKAWEMLPIIEARALNSLDAADLVATKADLLSRKGEFEQALAISYNLMAEMPHKSGGYSKAIEQLLQLNRTQEAMNLLEQMKENCKEDEDIGITYGVSKLQFGDLKQGFAAYERRFDREEMVSHAGRYIHYLSVPRINHWREAVGKRVVVYLEQGIGDIVQFFRYIPLLRAHASKIILVYGMSSKPFRELLSSLNCVDEHYDNLIDIAKDPLPHFDAHCALMSLPYIFETTIDTIPPAPPFIIPQPLIDQWGARLGAKTKPRIGLVVSGNAMQGNDFNRSANLSLLQPLIHENAETILVQRDLRAPDVELAKQLGLLHLGKEFNTLQDTAAAYHHFDLIIGIETGIMHLAATQGKPVWKMLTTLPDWRYFRDRSDSPFYPNVRLFRQEKYGDWHGLAQQVRPELDKFIASLT